MTHGELRDRFAGLAMQSIIIDNSVSFEIMCNALGEDNAARSRGSKAFLDEWREMFHRYAAHEAYQQADAMMIEREKP